MCVGKLLPRRNCFNIIHVNFWINYCKKQENLHFYSISEQTPIFQLSIRKGKNEENKKAVTNG